jgi:hypothetical protein
MAYSNSDIVFFDNLLSALEMVRPQKPSPLPPPFDAPGHTLPIRYPR